MIHDKSICEKCRYNDISGYSKVRHCNKCYNYGEKMLPATVRIIEIPTIIQIDCPHCDKEIISGYDNFAKGMGSRCASDWEGRIIKCTNCEKEIEIEDWEWD